MRFVIAVCLLSACGRLGFDASERAGDAGLDSASDSGSDAQVACTAFSAWAAPQTIAALNSNLNDWGPHLSHDQLTLYFASARGGAGDALYQATRASKTSNAWSAPVAVQFPSNVGVADDPGMSTDGLELYWSSAYGTRTSTATDVWTPQGQVLLTTPGFSNIGGQDISEDGLTLMFTGQDQATSVWHEYQAMRTALGQPWHTATAVPVTQTPAGEAYGSFSGDTLELVYATQMGSVLMSATRTSAAASFAAPTAIPELADAGSSQGDPDLSDDRLTMWFGSTRTGGVGSFDLWFSTRTCL